MCFILFYPEVTTQAAGAPILYSILAWREPSGLLGERLFRFLSYSTLPALFAAGNTILNPRGTCNPLIILMCFRYT